MRKLISLMLSFVLLISLAAPAFAATVKQEFSQSAVSAGQQVTVTVSLDEALTDVGSFEYDLYYDPALFAYVSAMGTVDIENNAKDPAKPFVMMSKVWDFDGDVGLTIEAGNIAVITFSALEDVTQEQAASFELVKDAVVNSSFAEFDDLSTENATVSITVSPAVTATYAVTLTEGEGYTITAAEGSESPVAEGGSYSFTVAVNEGYEGTPVVKANGLNLSAVDGVYTIDNITEDQTVTVEGIQEEGLPADKIVYQHVSGSQWPSGTPVYINTVTLQGLAVTDVTWEGDDCYITVHKKTAADAAYSVASTALVVGQPQMISMFSANINGTTYTGNSFTHSGSLKNGAAEIVYTVNVGAYTVTKTFHITTDGVEVVPETYDVTLTEGEGYTIAPKDSESPVTEGGSYSFTVTLNSGYEGTPVVKANDTELTAADGVYTIENITADQTVTVSGIARRANAYVVAASADVTANIGDSAAVSVSVTGYSDTAITSYNDYDVVVTYDPAKLTYASATAADTGAVITNDAAAGTVRITGHGPAKAFSQAVATLNFTAKASGIHNVTVSSAKIDNSGNAIVDNAADAAVSDAVTEVQVAYPVTLPENFTGNSSVLPNGDYVFTAPEDAEYLDITVTVGGEEVTAVIEGNQYTVTGVNGEVVVTVKGKTYNVTSSGTNATVNAADTAQYGKDYSFTVTPNSGCAISDVTVMIGEEAVSYIIDSTGAYVIAGKDIKGDITITVTAAAQAANTTQITFSGISAEEVVGGLNQIATNGQDFIFELNEEDGYQYTVMLGETTLKPDADGKYTISGDLINGTALTVTITKAVAEPVTVEVSVSQYITLDENVMWLVQAATDSDAALVYGEEGTMYWSDKYNAYCWLVVSNGTEDSVKAAAEAVVAEAAEGVEAATIAYDFDVNQTGVVDINDAQLAYDMYTALYAGFDKVTMDKFLEADLNGDGKVSTEDAAAIVNQIHPQN